MRLTILPDHLHLEISHPTPLYQILAQQGFPVDAPCGGLGKCGKCTVLVDGLEALACRTLVDRDMTVMLLQPNTPHLLSTESNTFQIPDSKKPYHAAVDIGTTTVAAFLLQGQRQIASAGCLNPQTAFGADVVSRIRHALAGSMEVLTDSIRCCVLELLRSMCADTGIRTEDLDTICIVGNPAMQQLFLGLPPENLAKIPYTPMLREALNLPARKLLPGCNRATLQVVPNIAGFLGGDIVAGALSLEMDKQEKYTLLVDIGTNGEMILGNRHRLMACSTAAGPALEGAGITFGMRGHHGAIDHVWIENGKLNYNVIGGGVPVGICGSGLIDAVAAALELGLLNSRGRILNENRTIPLSNRIYLTQEDIRQVQAAKGAIAAGILLMADRLGIRLEDIETVYLAGAFGSFIDPKCACRIGLLPPILADKITAVGNAAGSGASIIAGNPAAMSNAQTIVQKTEHLNLAAQPDFQRCFAQQMRFLTDRHGGTES